MPVSEAAVLIARDLGMKTTIELNHPMMQQSVLQEIYVLPAQGTVTTLMPNEKQYSRKELDRASVERWEKEYDPRFLVEAILECKHTRLGRSMMDGMEVEGFQTTDPNYAGDAMGQANVKIWVDVETKLPVRMEVDRSEENKGHLSMVVDNFQWDVPVEPTDFEPVIPDGYTPGRPLMQIGP